MESFFLESVPRASHCPAMVLNGRGEVDTDAPATCPAASSAYHIIQIHQKSLNLSTTNIAIFILVNIKLLIQEAVGC